MSININLKKFTTAPAVTIGVVVILVVINYLGFAPPKSSINEAVAGTSDNVSGYAWSENIGWISFNCTNQGTCASVDYGVRIDSLTGNFSGYAWSENIGWVKFDPAGPYPANPPGDNSSAVLNLSNNKVSGWARACAGAANPDCTGGTSPSSGGWDGWIKMNGTSPSYGVIYSPASKELSGFAWGSEVAGWISFNCVDLGVCAASSYKVIANINTPPSASQLSVSGGDYCTIPSHTFSWTFSDAQGGTTQTSYELQADNNSDFSSPEIAVSGGSSTSRTVIVAVSPGANQLGYNTSYYWRVKVFDSAGANSGWISPNPSQSPFSTKPHLYPTSNFTFTPLSPSQGEEIRFTQISTCYNITNTATACPTTSTSYRWDFDYETLPFTEDAIGQTATTTYNNTAAHTVALDATDADNNTCRRTQSITPKSPLPKFKETAPSG